MEPTTPLLRKFFPYFLIAFNVLFLIYVLIVSYYNRLALDDFGRLWVFREYGFLNPFTYWYHQWQGRFGPEILLTVLLSFYQVTSSIFFYPILLSSLFIYSTFQILKFYFPLSTPLLINYSILLFSALLLTTFELNTFFWVCASVGYFGGLAFALLGVVFILKKGDSLIHYVAVGLCFLYAGSSSEHVGALICLFLFLTFVVVFFKSAYKSSDFKSHFKNFILSSFNKKLVTAFFFCCVVFIVMILAPGTKVRMSATHHITDPIDLLRKSYDSTVFNCRHIFYKLPYIIPYIPLFLLFGSHLKSIKISLRANFIYVMIFFSLCLLALIFISNIPMAYAIGTVGPLRAYVYVSFFLVVTLFLLCVYGGFRYQSSLKSISNLSVISVMILFVFVVYTIFSELPLLRKYNETYSQRMAILNTYKNQKRTEPVFLQPLYAPEYVTITEMWRAITNSDKIPSPMSDMPVVIGEIGKTSDWRNDMLKRGLGLSFDVYLAPEDQQTEPK